MRWRARNPARSTQPKTAQAAPAPRAPEAAAPSALRRRAALAEGAALPDIRRYTHPSVHPPPPTDLMKLIPLPPLGVIAAAPPARRSAAVVAAAKARVAAMAAKRGVKET